MHIFCTWSSFTWVRRKQTTTSSTQHRSMPALFPPLLRWAHHHFGAIFFVLWIIGVLISLGMIVYSYAKHWRLTRLYGIISIRHLKLSDAQMTHPCLTAMAPTTQLWRIVLFLVLTARITTRWVRRWNQVHKLGMLVSLTENFEWWILQT